MNPVLARRLWVAAATLVTAAILVGCFVPRLPSVAPKGIPFDKVLHFGAFGALAFSWRKAGASVRIAIVGALALTAVTEVGQALFVSARSGDLVDAGADVLGALAGLYLARPRRGVTQEPAPREPSPVDRSLP